MELLARAAWLRILARHVLIPRISLIFTCRAPSLLAGPARRRADQRRGALLRSCTSASTSLLPHCFQPAAATSAAATARLLPHTAAAALPHARRWQTRTAAARPLARRGHVRRCHARAGLHRRLRGFARRSQLRSVTRTRRSLRPRLRRRAHGGRLVSSARPPTQRESRCYCVPCNHPL